MPGGQNRIITVLGMKGSGKTTLAMEIIREYPRVLILDASGEYAELVQELKGTVVEGGPAGMSELIRLKDEKRFVLSVEFLHDTDALDVLAVAFEVPGILVVLEEASIYCDPYHMPDEIARIVRYGRKRDIDVLVIARRPSEINRELTAQSDIIVSFRQMEPIDIAYLRQRGGKAAERVQRLPQFKVIVVGDVERAPLPVLARLDVERKHLTEEDQPE